MSFTLGLSHGPVCATDGYGCPCKSVRLRESIWYAASTGDAAMTSLRLAERPDLAHLPDPYGYTAVHFAAQRNHVRVLECLLAHGAPPDGVHARVRVHVRGHSTAPSNPKQRVCKATPLHRAAYSGATEACVLLVEAGAALNARDMSFGDSRTPLMKAASRQHMDVIDVLLQAGADASLVDSAGLSYLDIMKLHVHVEEETENDRTRKIEDEMENANPHLDLCVFTTPPPLLSTSASTRLVDDDVGDHVPATIPCRSDLPSKISVTSGSVSGSSDNGVFYGTPGTTVEGRSQVGMQCWRCGVESLALSKVGGKFCCISCTYKK